MNTRLLNNISIVTTALFISVGLFASPCFAEDKRQQIETTSKSTSAQTLPDNHRIIFGIVEGVNENTIKVNAGDAGEISPRYLELEKLGNQSDEVKPGDRLKITVNNKNKVVSYRLTDK